MHFKKSVNGQCQNRKKEKKRKEKIVSLNLCHAVFSVLDLQVPKGRLCHLIPVTLFSLLNFLNFEAGTDSVSQNFSLELPLYTASAERRSHMIWQSRPWCGSAWSGSVLCM
jgi:hypothetical protein